MSGSDLRQRQETQIVQSRMTLDDFLPGFWLPPVRWSDIDFEGGVVRWRAEHELGGWKTAKTVLQCYHDENL